MSFSKLMTLAQLKAIGVKDDRWTIQDKLLMYKGVIKIHSREQKNQIKDTTLLKKKNYKKISLLRKEVKELHKQTALYVHGDIGLTRRLLHNYKELQLAYMNMSLDKVIEDINHRVFCKKKQLNLIRHRKSECEKKLLRKQVHLGDLKFLISTPDFNRTDLKQQSITNAIQNYDVKFCAAKNIQSVYKRMLAILHKLIKVTEFTSVQDQRYYESILVTLQSDSSIQHKCLIRATEMGQLAMEEMANIKAEYTRLEKEVRNNMIERELCLKQIRDRLYDLQEETQGMVRTESEFDIQMIKTVHFEEPKKKGKDLEQEIHEIDEILTKLRDVTLVPKIENILPSMLETLRQKQRLLEELRSNSETFDDMLNKKNHAELMYFSLHHSGVEAYQKYEENYKSLQEKLNAQKEKLQKLNEQQDKISNISVRLRFGLQRLTQILEEVRLPAEYVDEEVSPWPVSNLAELLRPIEDNENIRPPINQEALRLMHLIETKMKFIRVRLREMYSPAEQERAFVSHFKHVSELMASNLYPQEDAIEAPTLIVDVVMEDSQVPNRIEIKARSQQIYIEATRNPFEAMEAKNKRVSLKKKLKP